jgi:uncharacterized protein (TIGR02246 family)
MHLMRGFAVVISFMLAGATASAAAQTTRSEVESIQYLLDVVAIQDVVASYAAAVDSGDHDGYAALFAEDAEFKFGSNHLRGRDEIMEMMAPVLASQANTSTGDSTSPTRLRHMMTTPRIDISGDTATVRGTWFTAHARSGDGVNIGALGYYNDTLVRRDGVWLYSDRNLVVELASEAAIARN